MLGVISGGDPRKNEIDSQQVPNFIHVENPYYYRCPWYSTSFEECGERAIKNLEKTIHYEGANNIAAIMMEGESGSSGCIKYPPFYWGILIIALLGQFHPFLLIASNQFYCL